MYKLKDSKINLGNILKTTRNSAVDNKKFKTIIPITNDGMFKAIFGREENIKFPCKLLSYIVDINYEELLKKLRFTKNETGKKKLLEKSYRNDLVVIVGDTTINIEMNNNSDQEIRDRNFEYLMRLRNDKKSKMYPPVIQININNFSYQDDEVVRRDYAVMSDDKVLLTNKIIVVDIYLSNIKKKSYNKDKLSEMERFLLIGIEEDRKKALEYVGGDILMKNLEETIEEVSLDDDLYEAYDKEWALKDQAERDGKEEHKREMVITMLEQGLFISEISYATKIPEEYIEKIIEEENIDYREETYDKEWSLKGQAERDGIVKGIEQGEKIKEKQIIMNLLDYGMSIEDIAKSTKIDIETIRMISKTK